MKKISLILCLFLLIVSISACGKTNDKNKGQDLQNSIVNDKQAQSVLAETMGISREYTALRLRTDDVLLSAESYSDYESWNDDMAKIIADWETLEEAARKLEELAGEYAGGKVSFSFINTAYAYTNQEISDVFDRAPAGKKIKTLAKFLGVDAKKAYQILKQDQAQVQADAWNKAGDTFQTLESSATVIKDACKVGVFVGTVVATGGTAALATGSTLSQAAVVVSGADLVLEITDDTAKIALGNHNKISQIVGDARVVAEPLAAVLMISSLPSNMVKGADKLNAVIFGLDQFNTAVQDGKVIGIQLPVYTSADKQKAEAAVLEKDEINGWLKDQKIDNSPETIEEIKKILNTKQSKNSEPDLEKGEQTESDSGSLKSVQEKSASGNNSEVVGIWEGILTHTPSKNAEEKQTGFMFKLNDDGTVDDMGNGKAFSTWSKEGDSIKLFIKNIPGDGYYEFAIAGDTLTFVKLAGPNSEDKWQEDYAGGDFFGGKFYEISLKKQ